MKELHHILVATDFGPASERAVDEALDLAVKFGSAVTVLHAYAIPFTSQSGYGYGYGAGLLVPLEDLGRAAQTSLDEVVAAAKKRYGRVSGELVIGEPWQSILDVAARRRADLIVVGTHGRRGVSRLFLGSVAERVVRMSPVPVLTVASKEDRAAKHELTKEIRP